MNELINNELMLLIFITLLAVISPGADFAVVTRNSYLYGRRNGIATALGIALGVWVHVAYSTYLMLFAWADFPNLLSILKYAGALYLLYIAYQTFKKPPMVDRASQHMNCCFGSFRYGLLTNVLNPKTALFIMSSFSQLVSTQHPLQVFIIYAAFISAAHLIWFASIALLFSQPKLRAKMLSRQVYINRGIGVLLAGLGFGLLLTVNR